MAMSSSFSAGTGAAFSLLPPENAFGQLHQVVQRVPVKILIDDSSDQAHPLRLGMSVLASVDTAAKKRDDDANNDSRTVER